jgi:hypothetical protein
VRTPATAVDRPPRAGPIDRHRMSWYMAGSTMGSVIEERPELATEGVGAELAKEAGGAEFAKEGVGAELARPR